MDDQLLRLSLGVDKFRRGAPHWLRALGFIGLCVMLSGSGCPQYLALNDGGGKAATTLVTGANPWSTNGA